MAIRRRRPPGATTRGGWGHYHQRRRAVIAPLVNGGNATCCRCHEPIHAGEPWHLDHNDTRDGYLGVLHAFNAPSAMERIRPTNLTRVGLLERSQQRDRVEYRLGPNANRIVEAAGEGRSIPFARVEDQQAAKHG